MISQCVSIEITVGDGRRPLTKADVSKNIAALRRALPALSIADQVLVFDTISILNGIKAQLPEKMT